MSTKRRAARAQTHNFSFIESLTREERDPFKDRHFQHVFNDIRKLEDWMRRKKIRNHWTLTEKLAYLRNVESTIRTGTAVRRTQLSWFAFAIGAIAAFVGFLIGMMGNG